MTMYVMAEHAEPQYIPNFFQFCDYSEARKTNNMPGDHKGQHLKKSLQ